MCLVYKEKMFHFWFNTFFVQETVDANELLRNGGTHPDDSLQNIQCLTLPKADLDRANKDKSHKLFSPNFKVRQYLSIFSIVWYGFLECVLSLKVSFFC